ncbi:hypothetical protein [Leptotrichia massiliensis]|uniref:toxin-antitoxin system YwqK family antitoxin n=1 Tax=Leptotrichia massiliensis TaxID=1852388 RepID=UPI0028D2796B|nr:hypothetical protein [Leptotrichia massiliensis]
MIKRVCLFIILNTLLYSIQLSKIEGLSRLSNYNEIKNIDVKRIYEKKGTNPVFDRKNGITYIKGEKVPFDGIMIARRNGQNITGIYQYSEGKDEGISGDYYENGQLYIWAKNINGKAEGESYEYYPNGKLKEKKFYKNDIVVEFTGYIQNGKLDRTFKQTSGMNGIITGYYENGTTKSSEMNVRQDYSVKGEINYIKDGESRAYDKQGRLMGIVNYKNNKMYGLPQKLFKNGQLKYEYVAASEKGGSDFDAMKYFKEYFDNSDRLKLDCDEQSKGRWHCKEYSKNGQLKNEFTSPTFALQIKRDNSYWTNVFLGIWNILIP